jgi:hypothetical protein
MANEELIRKRALRLSTDKARRRTSPDLRRVEPGDIMQAFNRASRAEKLTRERRF